MRIKTAPLASSASFTFATWHGVSMRSHIDVNTVPAVSLQLVEANLTHVAPCFTGFEPELRALS
jgi:hypothetical protein